MTLPTKAATWSISPCNRVVFTSLVQVQRDIMFGIVGRMLANGYTVKGSCNGTTGAMDGPTNRWAAATDAGTRGATTTTANSWICLTSANGVNILFSFVGASDDIYRISISHTGAYVIAATSTHTPTATDEQVLVSTTNILATASGDRLWSCWVRTDGKGFRVAVARAGAWVGQVYGCEQYTKATYAVGVTTSTEYGFAHATASSGLLTTAWMLQATAGTTGHNGFVRTSLGANLGLCSYGAEAFGANSAAPAADFGQAFAPELQGSTEFSLKRVSLYCVTASMRGKIGNVVDWWIGRTTGAADGDHYGNKEFIVLGSMVWPWDGTSGVAGTAIVMT